MAVKGNNLSQGRPEGRRTKKIASPGATGECDFIIAHAVQRHGWNYISTISLPVSSFQLAIRYHRHMANAMIAKVPP